MGRLNIANSELANVLEATFIHFERETLWNNLGCELRKLYGRYPNWNGANDLLPLGMIFQSYLNKFGFFPKYSTNKDIIYDWIP